MKLFKIVKTGLILVMFNSLTVAAEFDHSNFDLLLQKLVKDGLVSYSALNEDKKALTEYLIQFENVDRDSYKNWSHDEKMAFWINAYNAITIEGISNNYPIQWGGFLARHRFPQNSIRQIKKFWDTVFINIMGRDITLNQIEHEILRKEFNDPRIHFVIVCASIGCPVLESRAFFAEDLDNRLEEAARNFVNNPHKVRLDEEKKILYLSAIFDWYEEDFTRSETADKRLEKYDKSVRGVVEFVSKYIGVAEKNFILQNKLKIKYLKYDWSLNERK